MGWRRGPYVVVKKPGNAGGAKGPWVKVNVGSGDSQESGVNLLPPKTVEKLQATLHAKVKESPAPEGGWTN